MEDCSHYSNVIPGELNHSIGNFAFVFLVLLCFCDRKWPYCQGRRQHLENRAKKGKNSAGRVRSLVMKMESK